MKIRRWTAGILAGLCLMAGSMPAQAAGSNYTAVNGETVSFDKYLVMDSQANVPNQSFEFTIAPAAEGLADLSGKLVLQSGSASSVQGAPTIASGQAVFAVGDTTYTSVQKHLDTGTRQATQANDNVTLEEGEKYARKQVQVDFSQVSFSEPGVFRWVITETENDKLGISNDADATRNMDVYVVDNDGTLIVQAYVLHNDDSFQADKQGQGAEPAYGKCPGYMNRYTTHDLTLSKTVTGNQGSKDQYFRFTVNIQADTPGTKFDVDLSQADATTLVNAYSPEAHTNPAQLTLGSDNTVTQDFWLQHGQSIVIQGLPDGASYTITEATEDYRVATQVKEGDGEEQAGTASEVSDTAIQGDTTVRYTNDKTGIIPTNLITHSGPYAAIAASGICLLLLAAARRMKREKA